MKQTALYCHSLYMEALRLRENEHGCSAVMTYWLSIEAYLNDYTEYLKQHLPTTCSKQQALSLVLPKLSDSHIKTWLRLEIYHNLLTSTPLQTNVEPWQSAKLLKDIRNSIAHPRPTVQIIEGNEFRADADFETGDSHRKLFRRMSGAGLITGFEQRNWMELDWYQLVSEPKVSEWADTTTKAFLSYLASLIPVSTGRAEYIRLCMQMPWDRQIE